jgi:hypothetical protein
MQTNWKQLKGILARLTLLPTYLHKILVHKPQQDYRIWGEQPFKEDCANFHSYHSKECGSQDCPREDLHGLEGI